jgi:hypothetical protein
MLSWRSVLDSISPRFARGLRRATQRRALLREVGGLGPVEGGRVLRDLGLIQGDEFRLAQGNLDRPDLLPRLMRCFGLNPREVARNAPDVMHDLRRTCAMCSGAKQCAPRLDRSPRLARRARLSEARSVFAFCPNAHTLAALADAVPANAAAGAAPPAA